MQLFFKNFLNKITMYRLMLYFLLVLWVASILLSLINTLPYDPSNILLSGLYLGLICNLANYLLAKIFNASTNLESASITALILTLIVGPFSIFENILALAFIGMLAMTSKYILAVRKKHIFNPAAISVLLSAYIINVGASWWIGSLYTLPIIILGGLLVLFKIERFEMVASFLLVYFLTVIIFGRNVTVNSFFIPSVWFFVFVMLVEPLTSPSTKRKQMIFGGFVALTYFLLPRVIPGYAYGLEISLLIGNLISFAISPSFNIVMIFRKKEKIAKNIWQFYFEPMSKFKFIPGQYLEWTYPHKNADSRGTRRYFTISSAPEEEYISYAMRVTKNGSSFKSALLDIQEGDELTASSPQGEFVLPKDESIPVVFIAGGIGITPFRSIVKHLLTTDVKRDIILLYSNNNEDDIVFKEILDKANRVGVRTFYIITKKDGYIDEQMIKEKVPDFQERYFFISGSKPMVDSFKKMLSRMKVKKLKTDFFPGYTETHQE